MFYAYILRSLKNGSFYIGSTSDLAKRIARHNRGGSVYTKKIKPLELVWSGRYNTRSEAIRKEREIKSWKRKEAIEKLVEQFHGLRGINS